jgi:Lrp/AsnC family leucine-responsive transcriptional regulator
LLTRSIVLHVAAETMSSYDAFTHLALHAEEHVRSFKTLVVLQHPKQTAALAPPGPVGE